MVSILRGLYNGTIIPWERRGPRSEALLKIIRKIEDEEQYFIQTMSPDDCQRFQALSKLYSDLDSTGDENTFSYGFAFGMLLTMDVMKEAEALSDH